MWILAALSGAALICLVLLWSRRVRLPAKVPARSGATPLSKPEKERVKALLRKGDFKAAAGHYFTHRQASGGRSHPLQAEGLLDASATAYERAGRNVLAGAALFEAGKLEESITVLEQAGEENAADPRRLEFLGRAYTQSGKRVEAIRCYQRLLAGQEVNARNVQHFYRLAVLLEEMGDAGMAAKYCEMILLFDYNFEDVAERHTRLRGKPSPAAGPAAAQGATQVLPTVHNRYQVIRELGRGGMGIVYLAKDTRLDRLVAYKVLPDEAASFEDALASFSREARLAAKLNHPTDWFRQLSPYTGQAAAWDVASPSCDRSELYTPWAMADTGFIRVTRILIAMTMMAIALAGAADARDGGKKDSRLQGRVTDLYGMAIPQVEVLLETVTGKPVLKTLTDSDGDFLFRRLATGSYRLQAAFPGFRTRTLEVELGIRQARHVDVGLHLVQLTDDPFCQVTGRVARESDGQPLRKAVVKAVAAFDYEVAFSTVVEPDGRFTLRIYRPAQYLVFAHASGYKVRSEELVCQAGRPAALSFRLHAFK